MGDRHVVGIILLVEPLHVRSYKRLFAVCMTGEAPLLLQWLGIGMLPWIALLPMAFAA